MVGDPATVGATVSPHRRTEPHKTGPGHPGRHQRQRRSVTVAGSDATPSGWRGHYAGSAANVPWINRGVQGTESPP